MNIAKPYASVSLSEAATMVKRLGDKVTILFSGEMGIGKSSILKTLKDDLGDKYHYCYADMTTKDVGDFLIPSISEVDGVKVSSFIPNEEFGFHLNKPVVLMLDEIGKANRAVLNACLRLMLERCLGTYSLPEGSIVFATTNLAIEGLGDVLPPHARNRVVQCKIRKSTGMEWIENFAIDNGVHPVVIGAAMEYPDMFESFENVEDPNQNHKIFHPKAPRPAFVTPRGLKAASDILHACSDLSDSIKTHMLIGAIGEAAAMDLMTLHKLDEDLPTWEQIIAAPDTTKVPKSAAASCMLVAKAVARVERESFDSWMAYVKRMPKEAAALFTKTIIRNKTKSSIAVTNQDFNEWSRQNLFLFT